MDDELVEFGPRRSAPLRWLWVLAVSIAIVAAAGYAIVRSARGSDSTQIAQPSPNIEPLPILGPPASPIALPGPSDVSFPAATAAVVLGEIPPGGALERRDDSAAQGPWTVIVRRHDGSLGRHGAVITYPVAAPAWAHPVRVGRLIGSAVAAGVVWPLGGAHARIRGDLTDAELVRIATSTSVSAGRPTVHPPAGFSVVLAAPYRSVSIHEIRYGASQFGSPAESLGGIVYTGLLTAGGGFEDQLYALSPTDAGMVHGRPAVASPALGGNGTVAWEITPGSVAYIGRVTLGYGGAEFDQHAIDVLRQLAGQSRALVSTQWQASGRQVTDQLNEFG